MSSFDETSECTYINLQCLNASQTNSNSIQAKINEQSNAIVKNMSDYNVYLMSMSVVTSDLPYRNFYNNISWDPANFLYNRTNLSISFISSDPAEHPFDLAAYAGIPSVKGIGTNAGNDYQGVTVFLDYVSENSNPNVYPVPDGTISSAGYPRSYFNLHSINQFIGFINNAIATANDMTVGNELANVYFSYDPLSQLYQFTCPDAFKTSNLNMYCNAFLERFIDGFRWAYYKSSNVTSAAYDGLDYQFVKTNYLYNKSAADDWTYTAEYSTLANLIDIHSILLISNYGDLSNVRQQIVPASTFQSQKSLDLPSVSALKSLDIDFTSLSLSSINNCFIQYEAPFLSFPINCFSNGGLQSINIDVFVQTITNEYYPLEIPAGGYCNVKICLRKKKKNV